MTSRSFKLLLSLGPCMTYNSYIPRSRYNSSETFSQMAELTDAGLVPLLNLTKGQCVLMPTGALRTVLNFGVPSPDNQCVIQVRNLPLSLSPFGIFIGRGRSEQPVSLNGRRCTKPSW